MNNLEYDNLVKKIIKKENPIKNIVISFISGGCVGLVCEVIKNLYISNFNISESDAYSYVFITLIVIGSFLTGIGVFDKVLSIFKCGLIVPSTGFANTMTSSAMDYNREGFIRGIGGNIFKLTGSIILYGSIFGLIFGLIRVIILWQANIVMYI